MATPVIPEYITVHLGPPDQPARNIRVPFIEYIKNVASSEIYPTWPENAIRANILAQISFALNRIYTEYYPSRGFDFDITNSTQHDQKFIEGRDYYENIVRIVDDIFNNYVVRQGSIQPYFTQYCDGVRVVCEGLSQWGTVDLANQGLLPYEILQYYYGDDIDIITDAPVAPNIPSYPGVPLRLGDSGEDVRTIQRQLNRIGDNYPAIPKIPVTDGIFNQDTEDAVRQFQQIFNLTVDGIVGKATWYKVKSIYNAVKRLNELYSEGISLEEAQPIFESELSEGDTGNQVRVIQYYLAIIGYFDEALPVPRVDGIYDADTRDAVFTFQSQYGLPVTGVVDRATWNKIQEVYRQTISTIAPSVLGAGLADEIYPGRVLTRGMQGDDVEDLQTFLRLAAGRDSSIPMVEVTGVFDDPTDNAVRTIQEQSGLPVNGAVGPLTWERILQLARGTA